MRHIRPGIAGILAIAAFLATPSIACNYSAMMRSYNRAVEKYLASPTPARADRICRIIARIENKWGNSPPNVKPDPPAGVMCTPMPELGNGRGGGPGGGIIGVGFNGGMAGWVRNLSPESCIYDWEIVPDPANPPGFTIFPLSGSLTVPAVSSASAPFDVDVDGLVPPGTTAFFDIYWTHTCTGNLLSDESSRFSVFADPEITLLPLDPFLLASPGVPLPVMFEITNHTGSTVMRTFDFVHVGDPGSLMELNDGTPFGAVNLFPADKSLSSVDVTVDPLDTTTFLKETLMLGEICDAAMINCCGLETEIPGVGIGTSCAYILNDDMMPRSITHLFQDLEVTGAIIGGENLGFQIGMDIIFIQSDPLLTVPEHLDLLAQQTLFGTLNVNGFNYFPIVDDTGLMLMAPLFNPPIQFFSNEPGLQWFPSLPPIGDAVSQWPLVPPGPPAGLELSLQALTSKVNGWTPARD